jgi:hypothetical protein
MPYKQTQIVTSPELISYPFTFKRYIKGEGAEVTVIFPTEPSETAQLLEQAKTQNPPQIAAYLAAKGE